MTENTEWLLLEDAVRVYGNPQLWVAYEEASLRAKGVPRQSSWLESRAREWRDQQAAYQVQTARVRGAVTAAERALYKDFKDRLRAGNLMAVGIREPIVPEAGPEPIVASLWDVLQLDARGNRVHTKGLVYVGVRIRPDEVGPNTSPEERPSPEPTEAERPTPQNEPIQRSQRPIKPQRRPRGRPTINNQLSTEMRRRAKAGKLLEGVAAESRALHEWAKKHIHGETIPVPESIEKALSTLYRELRGDKKGR